ncbi:MAG: Ribosome-binding factor A [Verrucomicrobia bacterium ADurb.Bin474]|mgnify:CR=1 FL=1|nr:MAG: Ribosome-binding factor A [Verrucomicrobia bacterium ADurb.Bin474]
MANRMVRVNSLVHRELSDILHSEFQLESVGITLTEVDVAPDLRTARVFYSVIGDETKVQEAAKLLRKVKGRLRFLLGNRITLKYMPNFSYHYDSSIQRGSSIIELLDDLDDQPERNDHRE